jgi:hypothetical protein
VSGEKPTIYLFALNWLRTSTKFHTLEGKTFDSKIIQNFPFEVECAQAAKDGKAATQWLNFHSTKAFLHHGWPLLNTLSNLPNQASASSSTCSESESEKELLFSSAGTETLDDEEEKLVPIPISIALLCSYIHQIVSNNPTKWHQERHFRQFTKTFGRSSHVDAFKFWGIERVFPGETETPAKPCDATALWNIVCNNYFICRQPSKPLGQCFANMRWSSIVSAFHSPVSCKLKSQEDHVFYVVQNDSLFNISKFVYSVISDAIEILRTTNDNFV